MGAVPATYERGSFSAIRSASPILPSEEKPFALCHRYCTNFPFLPPPPFAVHCTHSMPIGRVRCPKACHQARTSPPASSTPSSMASPLPSRPMSSVRWMPSLLGPVTWFSWTAQGPMPEQPRLSLWTTMPLTSVPSWGLLAPFMARSQRTSASPAMRIQYYGSPS